jgi:hypothetical protein
VPFPKVSSLIKMPQSPFLLVVNTSFCMRG